MATLKRSHAPVPWGAHVEQTVWKRSQSGKPRRQRSDRPPLAHDPEWDGTRVLFNGAESTLHDGERGDGHVQAALWEDARHPILDRTCPTLSLLDIARYQTSKSRGKASSGLGEFEVVRVPKVVPVAEEEPGLGDGWMLGDWEKLDALGFKRSYSEVVQGIIDGNDPPSALCCSLPTPSYIEDDLWECL